MLKSVELNERNLADDRIDVRSSRAALDRRASLAIPTRSRSRAEPSGACTLALCWSRRVRTANLPDDFDGLRDIFARFTDDVVRQIERFADRLDGFVTALEVPSDGPPRVVKITLTITLPDSVTG